MPHRFRDGHQRKRTEYDRAPTTRPMGAGLDLWARRRDGTEFPVEISLSPMTDADGRVTIAIVRDITERRRAQETLRERERTFHAIFNATFQFIGLLSPEGNLLEVNQSLLDVADVGAEEVIGRPLWETPWWTHSAELRARLQEAVRSAAQGAFVRFEASHPRADGSLVAVDFSLKPVRGASGEVILLVKEGRDITDRARAELERERLLALAEEARRKVEESLRLRAEAERLKDDLTNMVVHDLKNPVSGITMLIQAALRRCDGLPTPAGHAAPDRPHVPRDVRLVQSVLEIARMEEGKMPESMPPSWSRPGKTFRSLSARSCRRWRPTLRSSSACS